MSAPTAPQKLATVERTKEGAFVSSDWLGRLPRLKAWALRNKWGGWLRSVYMHHGQLGETDAKATLEMMRKRQPDAKWRLVVVEVVPKALIPHANWRSNVRISDSPGQD